MKGQFEEIAVKEAKVFLKTVSEGLRALAKGVESLAGQVDGLSESTKGKGAAPKATAAKKAKQPAKSKAKAPKAPDMKKETPATASETVFRLINRSRNGIATAALSEKTGFNKKKIQNIVYRLRKQGKIKILGKGVYGKA